ncbi:hypothetical protein FS837_011634 [Tulasnella sp. UAMH 9824]|nr:hypothetical protein FS837_011634 [Tulasnella sp. UAMH 9824]
MNNAPDPFLIRKCWEIELDQGSGREPGLHCRSPSAELDTLSQSPRFDNGLGSRLVVADAYYPVLNNFFGLVADTRLIGDEAPSTLQKRLDTSLQQPLIDKKKTKVAATSIGNELSLRSARDPRLLDTVRSLEIR